MSLITRRHTLAPLEESKSSPTFTHTNRFRSPSMRLTRRSLPAKCMDPVIAKVEPKLAKRNANNSNPVGITSKIICNETQAPISVILHNSQRRLRSSNVQMTAPCKYTYRHLPGNNGRVILNNLRKRPWWHSSGNNRKSKVKKEG